MHRFPFKAPADRLDYSFDFGPQMIGGEALSAPAVAATPAGLTIEAATTLGTDVLCWISGGTAGAAYALTASATGSAGSIMVLGATLYVGPDGLYQEMPLAPLA